MLNKADVASFAAATKHATIPGAGPRSVHISGYAPRLTSHWQNSVSLPMACDTAIMNAFEDPMTLDGSGKDYLLCIRCLSGFSRH